MGMFDTTGQANQGTDRKPSTFAKLERMQKCLRGQEPDRVPISDFFWGSFIRLAASGRRRHNPVPNDLDWIATVPNMDPWIRPFETLRETSEEVIVKTGFGAVLRKKFDAPMPEFMDFEINTLEKLEALQFDNPYDLRRYTAAGDNQIAGVGDGFERNSPPWIDTVRSLRPDFPVFGSIIECNECLTRLIGPQNNLLWIGLYPERMGKAVNRIGQFYLDCTRASMRLTACWTAVIWGDVAIAEICFLRSTGDDTSSPGLRPLPILHSRSDGDLPRLRQYQSDSRMIMSRSASMRVRWRPKPTWMPLRFAVDTGTNSASAETAIFRSGKPATAIGSAKRFCENSMPPAAAGISSSRTIRCLRPYRDRPMITSSNWCGNTDNIRLIWKNLMKSLKASEYFDGICERKDP